MLIGLFAPPLTIVFYNFGLPLMLVLIYFKSKAIQINNNYINQKDVRICSIKASGLFKVNLKGLFLRKKDPIK